MSFLRDERRQQYQSSLSVTNVPLDNSSFTADGISPIKQTPFYSTRSTTSRYKSPMRGNDNFHLSISVAKSSVKINQFRRELSQLKSTFVAEVDSFQSVLAKARNDICDTIQRQSRANLFNRGTAYRQREAKITSLEQRVSELTEQIKQQKSHNRNTQVLQLQEDLEEKKAYIEEIEAEYSAEIQQLKLKVQEQADTIREYKSMRFQLVQLQTQIDEKNRIIQKLKEEYSNAVSQLDTQIESNETAADDIQYTIESINQLKEEVAQSETKQIILNQEISKMKNQLDNERNENNLLRTQLNNAQEKINNLQKNENVKEQDIDLLNSKLVEMQKQIAEKDNTIESQMNEISVLEAEKLLVSQKHPESTISESLSSVVFNSSQKELQKVKIQNLTLTSQLEKATSENKELNNLVQALRVNMQQSEESMTLLKDQLMKSQSSFERKETRAHSFKEEIMRLQSVVEQKEKLISELMESENNRSKEIERLHSELERSTNETLNTNDVDEKFHQQFQEMSQKLSESNTKLNSMDLLIIQQNEKIKEQNSTIQSQIDKIASNEKENIRVNQENASLKQQNDTYRLQTESTIKRLQRELNSLQEQFDATVKENAGFSEKYNNLMKNIQTNTEKADQLFMENTDLRRENAMLIQQVNTELLPMRDENQRLKDLVEKLRKTERIVTEENTRMFTENEILKKTSTKEVSILNESVDSQKNELARAQKIIDENEIEIERCHSIINKLYKIYQTDSPETAFDLAKQYMNKCEQLQKIDAQRVDEVATVKNETKKLKQDLSECHAQISTLNHSDISQKKEIQLLKDHIEDLEKNISEQENALSIKSEENQDLQKSYEKLNEEVNSIQETIEFTSIDGLKDSILELQTAKKEAVDEVKKLQEALNSSNADNRKQFLLINDLTKKNELQRSQIDRLSQKLNEARSQITEENVQSHQATLALKKEVDDKDDQIELMKYEFERFHSIVSFANVDDLFSTVSALLDSRNQEIEKLNFANTQNEAKYNQKITELTNSLEKVDNQLKNLTKVRDEKLLLSNRVKVLETELSNSRNDFQQCQSELEVANQRIKTIVLALSTFTKCEKAEDVEVVLDSLRSKLALRKEKIKDIRQSYSILIDENGKLKSEIETIKSTTFEEKNSNERKEIEMKKKDNENLVFFGVNSIDQLQQKYTEMQKAIEKYQIQTKTHEIEIQNLNDIIKVKTAAIENFSNERDSLTQMNQTLVRKYNEVEELYLELKEKNLSLSKKSEKESQDNKELTKINQSLSDENQVIHAKLQNLTSENLTLSTQIRDLTKTNQRFSAENSQYISDIQNLKAQNASLTSENSNLFETNRNLTLKNTTITSQYDKIKAENEEATKSLNEVIEQKKEITEQITGLTAKIETLTNEKETAISHNATLQSKFDSFNDQIHISAEKLAKATDELDVLKMENKAISTKAESQTSQITSLMNQNKQLYAEKQSLATRIDNVTAENRQLNSKITSLSLQVKRLAAENDQLAKSQQADTAEFESLQVENQSLKAEKESLKSNNEFLSTESQNLSKQYDQIVNENDQLKTEIRLLKNKVKTVENEAKVIRQQSIAYANQNNQLMSENKSLSADNRLLLSKNSTFNVQAKNIMDNNEALMKKNSELETINNAIQIENKTQASQIKSLTGQLDIVQQKYAQLTVLFENADTKSKQSTSDLQISRSKEQSLVATNKKVIKRNETLTKENELITTENQKLKLQASSAESKNLEYEQRIRTMKTEIHDLSEKVKEYKDQVDSTASHIIKLKKKLRISRKEINELEAAKRLLVAQSNELESLKNELRVYDNEQPAIQVLSDLLTQNNDLFNTMEISKKENEAYHKETSQIINQCNSFISEVFKMLDNDELRDYALPLTKEEMAKLLNGVIEYKNECNKAKRFNNRIVEEANNVGYQSNDIEGAINHISRAFTEGIQNGDVEELHRTITDITSASDKRKQTNREAVDRLKKKNLKLRRKNDTMKEVVTELINFNVDNENANLQILIDNLAEEELELLGIEKDQV
ncbi:hypothetical protein TRFO_06895 [Tritrichomonas foetus]|uniref:Uncharacterized protein n=1 Tax=Tritrichomonas foetus TaxID=1144522 RepID=A0A1J4JV31_9EUKA|nr:hypothetical protein TRFO_06895 [Tritrichomonas foetus]|eukprot:OHT02859.1 hypothetical protein TRFO_06895 [Tritrichomonas foetus]